MRTVCNSQKWRALDIESNHWVGIGNYKGRLAGHTAVACQPSYVCHACLVPSPRNSIGIKFPHRDFRLACGSCLDIMWFCRIVIGCYVCWNVVIGQFTTPNHCTVHNGVSKCSSRSSNAHLHTYAAASITQQLVEDDFMVHTYIQTYVHASCPPQLIPYLGTSFPACSLHLFWSIKSSSVCLVKCVCLPPPGAVALLWHCPGNWLHWTENEYAFVFCPVFMPHNNRWRGGTHEYTCTL